MQRKMMGSLKSPLDLRDYKIAKISKSAITLPEEFTLLPKTIKDQGSVGSCVAHALSSLVEEEGNIFSTGWIYGYRPEEYWQGEGMYPREALKTLNKLGAVKHNDFPYNIEMFAAKDLVDKNLERLTNKASENKIYAYAKMTTNQEIKEFLFTTKTPIPFSINTTDEGLDLDEDNIIIPPSDLAERTGGHMMLILGWNKKGFIIQNSWGADWGDNGIAILPYEYPVREAWAVTLKEPILPEPEPVTPIQPTPTIKRPNFYFLRQLLQLIIDFLMNRTK